MLLAPDRLSGFAPQPPARVVYPQQLGHAMLLLTEARTGQPGPDRRSLGDRILDPASLDQRQHATLGQQTDRGQVPGLRDEPPLESRSHLRYEPVTGSGQRP